MRINAKERGKNCCNQQKYEAWRIKGGYPLNEQSEMGGTHTTYP